MKTKDMILVALFTAILCAMAPLSFPLSGGVPISLGTLLVMLIAFELKQYRATLVILLYIFLAMMGLPVLSGYVGGIDRVLGMTGGYIIGYLPLAFIVGFVSKISIKYEIKKRLVYIFISMLIGTLVLYTIGTIWFLIFTKTTLSAALMACVIPFIPGDILKMIIVLVVALRIEKSI